MDDHAPQCDAASRRLHDRRVGRQRDALKFFVRTRITRSIKTLEEYRHSYQYTAGIATRDVASTGCASYPGAALRCLFSNALVLSVGCAILATACSSRNLDKYEAGPGNGGNGGNNGGLCGKEGWCTLAGTALATVCPAQSKSTCGDVTKLGNSAVFDAPRQRMVIWGGGFASSQHQTNEVYAVNLQPPTSERLTDPIPSQCSPIDAQPAPVVRQTFDGIALDGSGSRMLVYGGESACAPFVDDLWALDLTSHEWKPRITPGARPPPEAGIMMDRDEDGNATIIRDQDQLWRYRYDANTFEKLGASVRTGSGLTGRVDPDRRQFVMVGCEAIENCKGYIGVQSLEPPHEVVGLTAATSGCESVFVRSPGVAYDTETKTFVIWPNRGSTVYLLDPDLNTPSCQERTFASGPPAAVDAKWAAGRFRAIGNGEFLLVYGAEFDAQVLQLRP